MKGGNRIMQQINSLTGQVLYEHKCASLKLCIEAAVTNYANLRDADLMGANLMGADLMGANLRDANLRGAKFSSGKINETGLIFAGTPDGFNAMGFVDADTGELRVIVGCRHKSLAEGRIYWSAPDHPNLAYRREVLAALDYIEAVAKLRGWRPTP